MYNNALYIIRVCLWILLWGSYSGDYSCGYWIGISTSWDKRCLAILQYFSLISILGAFAY